MIRARLFVLLVAALIPLAGCADATRPPAATAPREPTPTAQESMPPVPVLRVGQAAAIDLFGNGQADVTVTEAKVSAPVDGRERLVVTIDIKLVRAGDPVTGGPENFRFRDNTKAIHEARTSEENASPQLKSVNLAVTGQESHGRLFFDVPAGAAGGGYVQLMTGSLVHAIWQIPA